MARSGPEFRIPNFNVQQLVVACSETVDWSLTEFDIPSLWKKTTGKGVKVAVLDTGCAVLHPDLKDQLLDAVDFTNSKVGPADTNGHGTHCCGVIAAQRNKVGIVGVAPEAKLLVGKVLGDGGVGSVETIVKGIEWAVSKKADIISMSFGANVSDKRLQKAVELAHSKGVLLIAAAGNEGPGPQTVGYPARYPQVLSVAAIDPNRKVAKFSSRGPEVDIAAPGVDILSCYPPKNYAKLSGTSMATPFVAGVVALLLSYNRAKGISSVRNTSDLIEVVKATAFDAGSQGFDNEYGWGLINPKGLILGVQTTANKRIKLPDAQCHFGVRFTSADLTKSGKEKLKQVFGDCEHLSFNFEFRGGK
jgi:subtilisin